MMSKFSKTCKTSLGQSNIPDTKTQIYTTEKTTYQSTKAKHRITFFSCSVGN